MHDILRGIVIQDVRVGDRVHLTRVPQHERPERAVTPPTALTDEFSVRWLRHLAAPVANSIDVAHDGIQKTKVPDSVNVAPRRAYVVESPRLIPPD